MKDKDHSSVKILHGSKSMIQDSLGRIAIFYPWSDLGSLICLHDAATLLAKRGYQIEIYTLNKENAFPPVYFSEEPISVVVNRPEVFSEAGIALPWWGFRGCGRPYRWWAKNIYRPVCRRFSFMRTLRRRHATCPYICFIGMDPEGLIDATPFSDFLDVPLVYWSLELQFRDEIKHKKVHTLKAKEIQYSRRAAFTIISDKWRAKALSKENGLDMGKIVLVPNAPIGKACRRRSSFLRDRFNIPPEKKVILCAGTIRWWAMTQEIVEAAIKWSDEYVLVIHSRQRSYQYGSEYVNEVVARADPERIIISFDPVSSKEYRTLVDSADVGLAFYNPYLPDSYYGANKNLYLMGLSSGKLAHYLHSGLPVIINETVGPRELVTEYQCGICVSEPNNIKEALWTVFQNYDQYVANACRCFNEHLEFENHFSAVFEYLEKTTTI